MAAAPPDPGADFRWPPAYRVLFVAIPLVVGGIYLWCVQASNPAFEWRYDKSEYYDLLGRGLASGHLYLPIEPSPQLLALPNPWNVQQSGDFALQDAVLYNRRYYLYHGVTPAILLFVPWRLITGHDMPEPFAGFVLCLGGYLFACATLLRLLTYLRVRPSLPLCALLLLALGFGLPAPFLLQRVFVYEIAILSGYFCLSAAFWFLLRGVLAPRMSTGSLAMSGLCFGLAIGSRPHLAIAAGCALAAVLWLARRNRASSASMFPAVFLSKGTLAFALPLAGCMMAIGAYNYARFANPFEFGIRYQIADPSYTNPLPEFKNVAPGLFHFFLALPDLNPEFPFVRLTQREFSPVPQRYYLDPTAGILAICPILLLVPWLFRRLADATIRIWAGAVVCSSLSCALAVASLGIVAQRYEMDFAPYLILIACLLAVVTLSGSQTSLSKGHRLGRWTLRGLCSAALIFGIACGLALGVTGPDDEFVQRRPAAYVALGRFFSPFPRYRLLYNPELVVEADFQFLDFRLSDDTGHGRVPLIALGRVGSRYLLTAEMRADRRVTLTAAGALNAGPLASAEVEGSADGRNRVRLEYRPGTSSMVVLWNGKPALEHSMRFLVTAPSQVTVGEDRTEFAPLLKPFPGRYTIREVTGL